VGMAKVVFHGDALKHNYVYNESSESLHLVDFDEGTKLREKIPRRSLNFTSDYPWFEAFAVSKRAPTSGRILYEITIHGDSSSDVDASSQCGL